MNQDDYAMITRCYGDILGKVKKAYWAMGQGDHSILGQ